MILRKIHVLQILLSGICLLLLLFHLLYNYMDFKSTNSIVFNRLSVHKISKYTKTSNHSSNVNMPVNVLAYAKQRALQNTTVMPLNITISYDENAISKDYLVTQFYNFTSKLGLVKSNETNQSNRLIKSMEIECTDPPYEEGGPITPNVTLETLDIVEAKLGPFLKPGGGFEPKDCTPKYHVALVVPFRDRYAHLSIFLRNIHPFLMKQRIAYKIFIIEQTNGKPFNRAAMMNVGFLEALKIFQWDCFIFHDVDLLPLDSRNLYNCPRQPRHMSVAIDTLKFRLPYDSIFGGVSAMTTRHFQAVNGFSNSFFGWGGEDDDMFNRIKHANLFISRYPVNIARYKMLKHQKEKANPKRYETLVNGFSKMEMDGINSIKYDIYSVKEYPTFTWYLVELKNVDRKN